ncbi:beta-galactosidase GalB [Reichenbachiella sp. MSK19-1]|uniref:beta-galactosidase GalB n=1 Tax=Reichenbachiella sp. MSK19-1 TaxID=1897631 RepID=UPI000E6C7824|nr:beta-galactosidase GalB [Reichenbachiella sp. MSK19-1]
MHLKTGKLLYLGMVCLLLACGKKEERNAHIPDQSFNDGWRFHKGELEAQATDYNDTDWEVVNLPHDWAIAGPFDRKHNARTGGLPVTGMGWYRKTFEIDPSMEGKNISIEFDGAMNDAYVWVNGELVGNRPFGYIGFEFDITNQVNFGQKNVIAVRLNPKDLSSRWYPGAGLYRNVRIKYNDPTHIAQWGTYITTPKITSTLAVVLIQTKLNTQASKQVTLKTTLLDQEGNTVQAKTQRIQSKSEQITLETELQVNTPSLWQPDSPYLYTIVSEILDQDQIIDRYETPFGIRNIEITTNEGLLVNGERVQLNGVCMHHDLGPLGSAVNYRATERQVEILQSMGVNAIRTSHNPPSPELLEICDKKGVLVIVEAFDEWKIGKVENGYNLFFDEWHERDLRDMIKRDRNHPSVVMWSIGNEILEQSQKDGWKLTKHLSAICHDEDPSRKTTIGFNYYPAPYKNQLAFQVDVVGLNYWPLQLKELREQYPDMILYGSETSSQTSSRGIYHLPIQADVVKETGQVSSYDGTVGPPWAYPPDVEFEQQERNTHSLGEFMWTGFDYLGEPTPYGGRDNSTNGHWNGDWPSHSSYFAPIDLVGLPKDRYYLYQSQWTKEPMIHLLPHWNWEGKEGEKIPVYAYTNAEEAELFVNGKSMGKKVKGVDKTPIPAEFHFFDKGTYMSPYRLSWEVPYSPGDLKVVAYTDGQKVASKSVSTAGEATQIQLDIDRTQINADGQDLSFVTVSIRDEEGNLVPNADHLIQFEVSGAGTIAAVGNGNPRSLRSFKGDKMEAFSGQLMLIVQSQKGEKGEIKIEAKADELTTAESSIQTL